MKAKLWQADGAIPLHPTIEAYTVGEDALLDQELLGYDIAATKAHVTMLGDTGIISKDESAELSDALDGLRAQWQAGTFVVADGYEDGHSAIEGYLTERLGDTGKKVHTGRSRNDQALVMMRLYLMDMLAQAADKTAAAAKAFAAAAKAAGAVMMPGYTHQQKAMPTTVALWLGSFADAFSDQVALIKATGRIIDQNPLGSAAGFGNTLPLDREKTTALLGFGAVQTNPMYCGLSRGTFELMAVQALTPSMLFAGKFAADMLLFTMQEMAFFSLPDDMTTGSSIMPHKHNYDVFEIMRGTAHSYAGYTGQLYSLAGGIGSGYSRDLQLTKSITMRAMRSYLATLDALLVTVPALRVNTSALKLAMTDELLTVTKINQLVGSGVPFREAYLRIKKTL